MSLVATKIQNMRLSNPEFDRNMTRPCRYGALDFFIRQNDSPFSIVTREMLEKASASMGMDVQIPVIQYDSGVTVGSSRSCTVADDENTSAYYDVTFQTFTAGFTMVPAMYSNNDISYEHDWLRKLEKVARAMAAKMDEAAVTVLDTNKTQVFNDSLQYTPASNVLPIPFETRFDALSDVETIMQANCYPGQVHIIGNAGIDALVKKLAQHSIYNDVDKRNEWENKVFHFTNNVDNDDVYGTMFAVEEGNCGVLFRYDRETIRRASALGHEWLYFNMPYINIPVGLHYYQGVGDQSAIAGDATSDLTCGIKEYYGFSIDLGFVVAYNSALSAVPNPIIKATIGKPVGVGQPIVVTNTTENPVNTKAATA